MNHEEERCVSFLDDFAQSCSSLSPPSRFRRRSPRPLCPSLETLWELGQKLIITCSPARLAQCEKFNFKDLRRRRRRRPFLTHPEEREMDLAARPQGKQAGGRAGGRILQRRERGACTYGLCFGLSPHRHWHNRRCCGTRAPWTSFMGGGADGGA